MRLNKHSLALCNLWVQLLDKDSLVGSHLPQQVLIGSLLSFSRIFMYGSFLPSGHALEDLIDKEDKPLKTVNEANYRASTIIDIPVTRRMFAMAAYKLFKAGRSTRFYLDRLREGWMVERTNGRHLRSCCLKGPIISLLVIAFCRYNIW